MSKQPFRISRRKYTDAAFDFRNLDSDKNYGIGSERIFYAYCGELGTVAWYVLTGKFVPHVAKELNDKDPDHLKRLYPMAGSLDYHYRQNPCNGASKRAQCTWLDSQPCWMEIADSEYAEKTLQLWQEYNDDAIFAYLEKLYYQGLVPTIEALKAKENG